MMSDSAFAKQAITLIDLTDLSDDTTPEKTDALITRALGLPAPVAAICIWPRFVAQAKARLAGNPIKVATVVNFPDGGDGIEATRLETRAALLHGADEIDLVLPWRALLAGRNEDAARMLRGVRQEIDDGAHLKVILETGALPDEAAMRTAARLALEEGADFLKTSTGKTPVSATPEAARILLDEIRMSGKHVGFKASGGIRTLEQARLYFDLAEQMMGTGWATPEHFRYGASGLLNSLLEVI